MKRLVQVVISAGLTVLIGYLVYRQVPDWGESLQVMIKGSPPLLLAGLSFITLHMFLRAARWGVLLRSSKAGISFRNLFSLTLVKYVVNIIPPRTGEVAASVVLARKENISAATVIAASVFERILDTITVLFLFMCYLLLFSHRYAPNSERGREIILSTQSYAIKGFVVFGLGIAILALLLRGTHLSARIPFRIRRTIGQFLDGFRALQSHGAMLQVLLLSLAIWLAITLQLWCLVLAYVRSFPLAGTLLLVALTVVGVAIPTPGGVGGFQYFMSLALVNFFAQHLSPRDPQSQAVGISNGSYLVSMVPVLIAGLICLNKEGLSLGRLSKLSDQAQSDVRSS